MERSKSITLFWFVQNIRLHNVSQSMFELQLVVVNFILHQKNLTLYASFSWSYTFDHHWQLFFSTCCLVTKYCTQLYTLMIRQSICTTTSLGEHYITLLINFLWTNYTKFLFLIEDNYPSLSKLHHSSFVSFAIVVREI